MPRFHLRHDQSVEAFLDALTDAALRSGAEGGDRTAVREAVKSILARDMVQSDLCGIFSNCDDVQFFNPFVKIPR